MANHMNAEQIKVELSKPDGIPGQAFTLLKELSRLYNSGNENTSRDLVLHALEHRDAFGPFQEILDALVRELGLFPYLRPKSLPLLDAIAYEYHRPVPYDEPVVFHREQAEVYRHLINGRNVILSAPTSFGKSKIIDAIISSDRYDNIVIIVPTIALIDETRRRLARFSNVYKVITQVSQEPSRRNVFVFTAERANIYEALPKVDFFVIDEFYKIGALSEDRKRTIALNQTFYKLSKGRAQFYLLGPCVQKIPDGFEQQFRCQFYPTTFSTVATEVIRVNSGSDDLRALVDVVKRLGGEPTLIFCKSPKRVNEVAQALLQSAVRRTHPRDAAAASWMQANFHEEWSVPRAVNHGIGVHHGKLPRSIGQYMVRAFNGDRINVLACTSTLIEGVNTKAKNVIIFDNTIAKQKFDFFTFNNIKGRSGRMFKHFVGRVFLFHEPPNEQLPFIDFPVFTQSEDTPDSILMQMEDEDLTSKSRDRIEPFKKQRELPVDLLQRHSSLEPEDLLNLAGRILKCTQDERKLLSWTGFPRWENLKFVCELAWEYLIKRGQAGVFSGSQMALKVSRLRDTPDIKRRILDELSPGRYAAANVDEAVERVLEFDRTWASFELPRILRAMSDVRRHILGGSGDYSYFAAQLESLFRSPFHVALEEFGIPLQVSDKLEPALRGVTTIDEVLLRLKRLDIGRWNLDAFERELVVDCQRALWAEAL